MRSPRGVIGILLVALCFGNLVETFRRSTIPLRLEGQVDAVEVRREKHPGLDDVHLLWIKGRGIHVDARVAEHLRQGDRISKSRWSSVLQTPRGPVTIRISKDFRGMVGTMWIVGWMGIWLLSRRKGPKKVPKDLDTIEKGVKNDPKEKSVFIPQLHLGPFRFCRG